MIATTSEPVTIPAMAPPANATAAFGSGRLKRKKKTDKTSRGTAFPIRLPVRPAKTEMPAHQRSLISLYRALSG